MGMDDIRDNIRKDIESKVIASLSSNKNTAVTLRAMADKISIAINEVDSQGKEIKCVYTLNSIAGMEEWNGYCLYVRELSSHIREIAYRFGIAMELEMVMQGWVKYTLKIV